MRGGRGEREADVEGGEGRGAGLWAGSTASLWWSTIPSSSCRQPGGEGISYANDVVVSYHVYAHNLLISPRPCRTARSTAHVP